MKSNSVYSYIKPLLYFAFGCGLVYWSVFHPRTLHDWMGCIGQVAIVAHVLLFLYDSWGWRYLPFTRLPRFERQYLGVLSYTRDGKATKKSIKVLVEQSLHSVSLTTETDEMKSRTLTSSFVEEEGGFSLYYTYRTTPLAAREGDNPVQTGTCRIFLERVPFTWSKEWVLPKAPQMISGKYWTSRGTVGDLVLEAQTTEKSNRPDSPPHPCDNHEAVNATNRSDKGMKDLIERPRPVSDAVTGAEEV